MNAAFLFNVEKLLTTARVSAIAADFRYILIDRIFTMLTAIVRIFGSRTDA